ncbi:MAG: metallophosphoesterase family protein, partial [Ruminococcus flavefaciens]|nr:metallophosphoesterase family protein [Ruminococcus flavefaciens]
MGRKGQNGMENTVKKEGKDAVWLEDALRTKCPLRFGEDGKFRILMVSDIHGGQGYAGEETVRAMQALVDVSKPDLVLLGGDIAGPGFIHVETEEQLRSLLDDITAPMENAGIPWAHVYGNHDDNYGVMREQQQPVYESYPHCVSKAGPEEISGMGNYVLPIWDAEGKEILFNVFGMDTHSGGMRRFAKDYGLPEDTKFFPQTPTTDCVRFDQILWYWRISELLEQYAGKKIPAMMYLHIPLPEFGMAALWREDCGLKGLQGENVCCPPLNTGLFAACLQRGDVKGIFCGHDHANNFCATYAGIRLGYDGYMSYHAAHDEELCGGRVFEISADAPEDFETRILLVRDALREAAKGAAKPEGAAR